MLNRNTHIAARIDVIFP